MDLRVLREDAGLSPGRRCARAGVATRTSAGSRMGTRTHRTTRSRDSGSCSARTCECSCTRTPERSSGPAPGGHARGAPRSSHPRWQAFTEVAVHRPSRGWIDAVLHEPRDRVAVATELQSELRRLEQLVRWSAAKAASLPSWDGWSRLGDEPRIDRLLVVRRTRAREPWPPRTSASCASPTRPIRTMPWPRSTGLRRSPARRSCGR